ncbi:MAG: hypothetical protein WAT71_05400 [Ignavibacteria bacterium]
MVSDTKYMGIDYGEKRIGISVSDESKKFSFNRNLFPQSLVIFGLCGY